MLNGEGVTVEAVTTEADVAIEKARQEGETERCEIQAETQQEIVETVAAAEVAVAQERGEAWREEVAGLQQTILGLSEEVTALRTQVSALSIQESSTQQMVAEVTEEVREATDPPAEELPLTDTSLTVDPESDAPKGPEVADAPPARPRRRWM